MRGWRGAVGVSALTAGLVSLTPATAQGQPAPAKKPPPSMDRPDAPPERGGPRGAEPAQVGPSDDAPDPEAMVIPTPPDWKARYDYARAALVAGDFKDAALRFAELESSAVNQVDRALARAHRSLADDWAARNVGFAPRTALAPAPPVPPATAIDKRSTDEIVSLYTNATLYGIGTGIWVGTLTQPETAAATVLPTVILTGGAIGTVLALDAGRGLRYAVGQSIVSGMWLGLELGTLISLYHVSLDSKDGEVGTYTTITWSLATAGAVGGGLLASAIRTTPGRASWVGSAGLWTGTVAGFVTGAATPRETDAASPIFAGSLVGLVLGSGVGFATASSVSPSVGRVRLVDLSGLLGGLSAGALYVAAASNDGDARAGAAVTALGIVAGLSLGAVATSSMAKDFPRTVANPAPDEESRRTPTLKRLLAGVRPTLYPAASGGMIGAVGTLD